MRVRWLGISTLALMSSWAAATRASEANLAFGQVYGSVGFVNAEPSGTMADAASVVLAFRSADGHRHLVLANMAGDYIALLEKGHYCMAAYTRAGKALALAGNQLKCVSVNIGEDVRLDVMLLQNRK
jgi:hypothetical protein